MAFDSLSSSSPQHAQSSLPSLPAHLQSDTHLTAHLASRFHAHLPTANISSHALVTLNTYTNSNKGANGGEEGSGMAAAKELAAKVWTRLGHRGENQAVVFLGESGSGKTTIRSHVLAALLNFSSTPLSTKLSYAAFVFDTITSTKSLTTPTASKAGLFYELQYDTSSSIHPTVIGGKILNHRLERSRISSVPTGERNFHILYYLLAGTSHAEKQHLGLDKLESEAGNRSSVSAQKRWRYLGHPTQLKVGMNDAEGFQHFKTSLRKLEVPRSEIAEICQILACVLHLGQLEFIKSQTTTPAPDESGGYSHEGGENVTAVKNRDVLGIIAAFLGIAAHDLEICLANKSKTLHNERVTVMLDPVGARANADELARTLYALLVAFIMERVNDKICAVEETIGNTISIVDFPGFAQTASTGSALDQLLNNSANESLYNFCQQSFFDRKAELLDAEDVSVPATSYFDNSDAVKVLLKPQNGLLSILDDQMGRRKTDMQFLETIKKRFEKKNTAITVSNSTATLPGSNFATKNLAASFTIRHYAGEVEYAVDGLIENNGEIISGDLMNLINSTRSDFVRELFGQEALTAVHHPQERTAIMQASVSSKPMRMPSMARRKTDRLARSATRRTAAGEEDTTSDFGGEKGSMSRTGRGTRDSGRQQGAAAQFLSSLENISKSLTAQNTNSYFVFCLKPNDRRIANQFDSKCVRAQIQTLGIAEISQRVRNVDFSLFLPFSEFLGLCEGDTVIVGSERERVEMILDEKKWPEHECFVGSTGIFLSERCWLDVANVTNAPVRGTRFDDRDDSGQGFLTPAAAIRGSTDAKSHLMSSQNSSPGAFYHDDKGGSYFGSKDVDGKSEAGHSAVTGDMFRNLQTREQMAEKGNEIKMEAVEEHYVSGGRKRWLFVVYMLTFWCPDFVIRFVGRMSRKDVRIAWREKLAINMLIWLSIAAVIFLMVGFPNLICPKQYVFSNDELSGNDGQNGNPAYIGIRGVVYDLGAFAPVHYPPPTLIPSEQLLNYAGRDATNLFPVQVSALCDGKNGEINPLVQFDYQNTNYSDSTTKIAISGGDPNARYHDFRAWTGDSRPDWFWEQQLYLQGNYEKGRIGYSPELIKTLGDKGQSIAMFRGSVYDFTSYVTGGRRIGVPQGQKIDVTGIDTDFMDDQVVNLFQQQAGNDVTQYWDKLNLDPELRFRMEVCMNNLFYVGKVDTRNSTQCLFATYLLLAISLLLVSVIGFKFLAALQFGKKNMPENLDKFVICTVPAYTEDEESLRRAIDSAARMRYDDKRKLLVIICDGMIIGQGNDRPTPRIVLDILGVSESVDPQPLSFESLGEGLKQHNMGKVYSGLYEVQGHIVPFLVVVKVGKPSEVQKPGNRGKRDSQMILMRFLNRVHYNLPMTPMELEMHHQIRNIIGVNPTFYEFLLQIDADTVVAPDSATRMVAAFLHDTRLIGVCGETALTNAKSSFTTMIQVYEYYISHNLTKAFESLFGSVTCLPGCFTMYRIRAAETGKPLFVSKEVVEAYSEIRVDTLHMKNLLHLGEDRYLTTLLLKFHSKYKTKYIFRAHAWTIAPDSWTIFLSQRRRWINSTVHNLIELIPIQQLCGFCCFSMRFVVFIDLLSTVVQPTIIVYIAYLIYLVSQDSSVVPLTAFVLLGAIYGLQAIIFILRRKWEMIGWMIIYMLATPVFAFCLPLYAFWHMDDFSWGNTRVVTGEKGQKVVVSDEGKFDPSSIPRKKWEEYQAELWDAQTQRDDRSEISGISYGTKSLAGFGGSGGAHSEYGFPPSRPMSQLDMPRYGSRMSLAPSGYGGYVPSNNGELEMDVMANLPSDDALLAEIREILRSADLMTITKKSVKMELERRFGCNMDAKRAFIGSATEAILSGQL
jgi:chitin synthase